MVIFGNSMTFVTHYLLDNDCSWMQGILISELTQVRGFSVCVKLTEIYSSMTVLCVWRGFKVRKVILPIRLG